MRCARVARALKGAKPEACVAERRVSGIEIAEQSGADHAIERVPTGVAAFIGRTLKGPLNRPIPVDELRRVRAASSVACGNPSTLSYAVEQFFENGGREAYIVRVANGARPPTLTLPAGSEQLHLVALNPGSREYLRASVDYDGIGENEPDRFNLVLQRVRAAGSELIEEQEIFRRLSVLPDSGRFVSDVLLDSRLARVRRPGADRSGRTARCARPGSPIVGYINSNTDGDDGGPLTDYDVIGSATERHGPVRAARRAQLSTCCASRRSRASRTSASSTLMIAARFCRDRHAMLVVDPPSSWTSASIALSGLREWPFRSENAVMYFPRVVALDRLRGRHETFGSCGAAAGMIARSDETWPVWAAAEGEDSGASARPASGVGSHRSRSARASRRRA